MSLFLDANVIFSAAYHPEGKSAAFIKTVQSLNLVLMSSDYAVAEAKKNMTVKHPAGLLHLDTLVKTLKMVSNVHWEYCSIDLPPKDQPIFMAAIAGHATHLITGDLQHFGKWMNKPKQTQGVRIQTINDFLKAL